MNLPKLDLAKAAMRRGAGLRRDASAAAVGDTKAIAELLLAAVNIPAGAVVSGYWPMRSELDPRPILAALSARGHPLCLPVVVGKGQALVFRAWQAGDELVAGGYGTQVPDAGKEVVAPHLLLVPLLAFDRAGYRLGYGGGFYDRTLAALRSVGPVSAVGLAYSAQEVDVVPHGATDERLDWVVTEAEAIDVKMGRR
ncbi:MAG: 5-formyltetrahydrofolate cyclo-ligase [Alphaproteobacteria bacterium]